jgi:hypothetical protein
MPTSRRVISESSSRRRAPAYGAITAAAMALRQNAMASAGAAAALMSGADVETPVTATAMSARSVREGRRAVLPRARSADTAAL